MNSSSEESESNQQFQPYQLLLKDFKKLKIKSTEQSSLSYGCHPMKRDLKSYLAKSFVCLDKCPGPSSHEVSSFVKKILSVSKSGHVGTLDPNVTGSVLVLNGKATKLSNILTGQNKTYVCVMSVSPDFCKDSSLKLSEKITKLKAALQYFTGRIFQMPPIQCAVKRRLRIRTIYESRFLEFDEQKEVCLFETECEAGTYIRTLCLHIGLYIGTPCKMKELRRIRSGWLSESLSKNSAIYEKEENEYLNRCFTLYDVLDAMKAREEGIKVPLSEVNWFVAKSLEKERLEDSSITQNEFIAERWDFGVDNYIKTVVRPIEALLMKFKKIFIKDSAVASVANGSPLAVAGVLRYDPAIEKDDDVVLATMKGEAVSVGKTVMNATEIEHNEKGVVAKSKIVIMEQNTYPKNWKGKEKEDQEERDEGNNE